MRHVLVPLLPIIRPAGARAVDVAGRGDHDDADPDDAVAARGPSGHEEGLERQHLQAGERIRCWVLLLTT